MRLTKQAEYGVRAVLQLARLGPDIFIHTHDLAKREQLPRKFLESILLTLKHGNFLESRVGRAGGYRLSRSPKTICLGEIIRMLEVRMTSSNPDLEADLSNNEFATGLINRRLTTATDGVLDRITLDVLLNDVNARTPNRTPFHEI